MAISARPAPAREGCRRRRASAAAFGITAPRAGRTIGRTAAAELAAVFRTFFRLFLRRLARRLLSVALDGDVAAFAIGQHLGAHILRRTLPRCFVIAARAVKLA